MNPYMQQQQQPQNPYMAQGGQYGVVNAPLSTDINVLYDQLASSMLQSLAGSGKADQAEVNFVGGNLKTNKQFIIQRFVQTLGYNQGYNVQQLEQFLLNDIQMMRTAFAAQRGQAPGYGTAYSNRPPTGQYGGSVTPLSNSWDAYRQDGTPTPAPQYVNTQQASLARRANPTVMSDDHSRVINPEESQPSRSIETMRIATGNFKDTITLHTTSPESDLEKQKLLTVDEVQQCSKYTTYAEDNDSDDTYVGCKITMKAPYTNGDNALEDLYSAYPNLREGITGGYCHLIEFNQITPISIPFEDLAQKLDSVHEVLRDDPMKIKTPILRNMLPIILANGLERSLLRQINTSIRTKLSLTTVDIATESRPMLHFFTITELDDLKDCYDPSNQVMKILYQVPKYDETMDSIIRDAVSSIFNNPLHDKPYLDPSNEDDFFYLLNYEGSGIRMGNCVGRNIGRSEDEHDDWIDLVIKQLHRRTFMLRKCSVIRSDLIVPEILEDPHKSHWTIYEAYAPIHTIIHGLIQKAHGAIRLDLRESMGRADLCVGLNRNKQLIYFTEDYSK